MKRITETLVNDLIREDNARGPKPSVKLESLEKTCENCGKTYTKNKFVGSRQFSKSKYCSRQCANARFIKYRENPLDWKVTTRERLRIKVRKVFEDKCALCGWEEAPCDIAHIDPTGDYYDIENVLMLCPNHHRMYDRGLIPKEEILIARKNAKLQEWVSRAS